MRNERSSGVRASGGLMDKHREEFRMLLGMAGIVLITLTVLLTPIVVELLVTRRP
jgi:hypothetical protein